MTKAAKAMPASAYVALDSGAYRASQLTRGPWHPEHQHAGPPIALVCRAVERTALEHGLTHISRLTANLLRPVPIGELAIEVDTDYAGRNAGHFSAHLMAGDKEVARFTVLVQRENEVRFPTTCPVILCRMRRKGRRVRRQPSSPSPAGIWATLIWWRPASRAAGSSTALARSGSACATRSSTARYPAPTSVSPWQPIPETGSARFSISQTTALSIRT